MSDERRTVSGDQVRVLANPLRIRILYALAAGEATAAQVADSLGESRGNVHYHIQKLYRAGLVDLVRQEKRGGVLEQYYHAAPPHYQHEVPAPGYATGSKELQTWLSRTPEEVQQLITLLEHLVVDWERAPSAEPDRAQTWTLRVQFLPQDEQEGDAGAGGEGRRDE